MPLVKSGISNFYDLQCLNLRKIKGVYVAPAARRRIKILLMTQKQCVQRDSRLSAKMTHKNNRICVPSLLSKTDEKLPSSSRVVIKMNKICKRKVEFNASLTIYFAWQNFKLNQALRKIKTLSMGTFANSIDSHRQKLLSHKNLEHSDVDSNEFKCYPPLYVYLSRRSARIDDYTSFLKRCFKLSKILEYDGQSVHKDTFQINASQFTSTIPHLIDYLKNFGLSMRMLHNVNNAMNRVSMSNIFTEQIEAECHMALHRYRRRSSFQRFVPQPHFLTAWPGKPFRIRIKYIKQIVKFISASAKIPCTRHQQLDLDKYYFRIDIWHGTLFVTSLKPSVSHSALLRKQLKVMQNKESSMDIQNEVSPQQYKYRDHLSVLNTWFESEVPAAAIPARSHVQVAIYQYSNNSFEALESQHFGDDINANINSATHKSNRSFDDSNSINGGNNTRIASNLHKVAAIHFPVTEYRQRGSLRRVCTLGKNNVPFTNISELKDGGDKAFQKQAPINVRGLCETLNSDWDSDFVSDSDDDFRMPDDGLGSVPQKISSVSNLIVKDDGIVRTSSLSSFITRPVCY